MVQCFTIEWNCESARGSSTGELSAERLVLYSVRMETIVTDPSPVAHLRVLEARLVPKPNHVVPDTQEMKRLVGLDQERNLTTNNKTEELDENDEEDEDDVEPLLHSHVMDRMSQELLKVLRARIPPTAEENLSTMAQELHVSAPTPSYSDISKIPVDIVEINRRGRWFSVVAELAQPEAEAIDSLMVRHFEAVEGEFRIYSLAIFARANSFRPFHSTALCGTFGFHPYPTYQSIPCFHGRFSSHKRRLHQVFWKRTAQSCLCGCSSQCKRRSHA
jgi:hypothetical protein